MSKFLVLLLLFIATGCSTLKSDLATFNNNYELSAFDEALQFSLEKRGENNKAAKLLWNLNAASVYMALQDHANSNSYFDAAEDNLRDFRRRNGFAGAGNEVLGALINDTARSYEGEEFEKIMTNTYKAINFAVLGDMQNARVEFNRALSRQEEAKMIFRKEIDELKTDMDNRSKKILDDNAKIKPITKADGTVVYPKKVRDDFTVKSVIENKSFDSLIKQTYRNLDSFAVYKDFVNPFSMYMASIFFWLDDDNSKAQDLMKEVYSMNKSNEYVVNDFRLMKKLRRPRNRLWVVVENGLGPIKESVELNIPLAIFTNELDYSGIALPRLKERSSAVNSFELKTAELKLETQEVASMDKIAATEFKKDLTMIIAREVLRVVWKTYTQKVLKDKDEVYGLAMAIFQAITTDADTRSWAVLPKNFHVASMEMPSDRKIKVGVQGLFKDIRIPDCKNAILYIKYINGNSGLICDFITFN